MLDTKKNNTLIKLKNTIEKGLTEKELCNVILNLALKVKGHSLCCNENIKEVKIYIVDYVIFNEKTEAFKTLMSRTKLYIIHCEQRLTPQSIAYIYNNYESNFGIAAINILIKYCSDLLLPLLPLVKKVPAIYKCAIQSSYLYEHLLRQEIKNCNWKFVKQLAGEPQIGWTTVVKYINPEGMKIIPLEYLKTKEQNIIVPNKPNKIEEQNTDIFVVGKSIDVDILNYDN